jgi:hypothetical protein
MKELKEALTEESVAQLREELEAGHFPGITLEQAMQFALTNGILPADDLPVTSFLRLETWLRERLPSG